MIEHDIKAAVDEEKLAEFKHEMELLRQDLAVYRRAQERYNALEISGQRPVLSSNNQEWFTRYSVLVGSARSDARSSLHLALARIRSMMDTILSKGAKERQGYLNYFGHLTFLHLAMLKTDFLDYSGSVDQLVALGPYYIQFINTVADDMFSSCLGGIDCNVRTTTNIPTYNMNHPYNYQFYYSCLGSIGNGPKINFWNKTWVCSDNDSGCGYPSTTDQSKISASHNFCAKAMLEQTQDTSSLQVLTGATASWRSLDVIVNTTALDEIVASVVTTPASQLKYGNLCVAYDTTTLNAILATCVSSDLLSSPNVAQLIAFDAKGQIHPVSDFSQCLSLSLGDVTSQQLVFRECLNLPTQSWHPVRQQGGNAMKLYLAVDPQNQWCITASTQQSRLTLGLCTSSQATLTLVPHSENSVATGIVRDCDGWHGAVANWWQHSPGTDAMDDYFQDNFARAMRVCRSGLDPNPLACPTKEAIWSPCITPRRVADDGNQFVPEKGWKYFFASVDFTLDEQTPVKSFTPGQSLNCGTENFGQGFAPGGTFLGCWAIPDLPAECNAKIPNDFCPQKHTFPNPSLSNSGICSIEKVTSIASSPSYKAWADGGMSFNALGTVYYGSNGNFVATIVDQRMKSRGAGCNSWTFFGSDPAYGYSKQCFFLPN